MTENPLDDARFRLNERDPVADLRAAIQEWGDALREWEAERGSDMSYEGDVERLEREADERRQELDAALAGLAHRLDRLEAPWQAIAELTASCAVSVRASFDCEAPQWWIEDGERAVYDGDLLGAYERWKRGDDDHAALAGGTEAR